ncbi:MAG: ATP-binding protein [bacterium]|nr:ATP-binding protein [bacterium]
MQWPTQDAFTEGRERLMFRLLLANKWFLIPSSVIYEWILSNSMFSSTVFDFVLPIIFYTVVSLCLILLLWVVQRRIAENPEQKVYHRVTVLLSLISYLADTGFILYLMFLPNSGNILWAAFLSPLALVLLVPEFKKGSMIIVDVAAALTMLVTIYTVTIANLSRESFISLPRFIPADLMLCLAGLLYLWVTIRQIRLWVNQLNQESEEFALWHALWVDMIQRFPTEIFMIDQHGTVVIASNAARKLLHLPPQGSSIWPEVSQSIRNALLLRFHAETDIEETIHIPDDSLPNPIKIFPTFFPFENKRFCIAMVQEENPELPTPTGVLRSDRLTIAGQIAAGLAHEIGNPLGVIQACAGYLMQKIPEDDPNREEYRLIQEETKRCQNLIDRLLSLASPKRDTPAVHDLRVIIQHSLSLIKYQAGEREIEHQEPSQPVYIYANEGQLSAVFVNLFLNALQSMEDCPPTAKLRIHMRTRGKEAIVDVTDEGMGIPKDDLEKIFDPFFTKKASGTGLGLSIVHQIIRSMEGRIDVASVAGAGTTFTVYLPMYEMEEE